MASTRQEDLRCQQEGCGIVVATATVTDQSYASSIRLDDGVTDAPGLMEFMLVGLFRRARVFHTDHDGRITHTIKEAS